MSSVVDLAGLRGAATRERENEPRGFAAFVVEHRTQLVRYATLLTGSQAEAEDIVQEVLVRLVPRWADLDEPLPYVRRSITNEFLSWRRRWSTRNIQLVDDAALDRPVHDDHADGPDPELWALLLALPPHQRSALVLRYYEGFDDNEIASMLSCRPATVRSHVHRGIATIRKVLNGREIGDDDA